MDCRDSETIGQSFRRVRLSLAGAPETTMSTGAFMDTWVVFSVSLLAVLEIRLDLGGGRADLVVAVEGRDLVALRQCGVVEDRVDEVVEGAAERQYSLADVNEL